MFALHTADPTKNRRSTFAALLTIPLVISLAACSAAATDSAATGSVSGAASSTSGSSSALVVAYSNAINTLDPQHADYAMTNNVISAVYDTLVTYDASNKLVGVLADKFTLSPDASSVAVALKSGPTFHDGTPVTATDVKYTLDRYLRIGAGVAGLLTGYSSTTVTDPAHLTIKLKSSNSMFLSALSKAYILEAKVVQAHAGTDDGQGWLQVNDAGSGPYQLIGNPVSGDIEIDRYSNYWAFDAKRPTKYTFKRIDQSATQLSELKAGNVDIALSITATDAATLAGSADDDVAYLQPSVQTYIVANMVSGPTTKLAVRQALQLAYDYKGGQHKILNGKGSIASGVLPVSLDCQPAQVTSTQNVAAAKKLLADAGISNLTLTLRYQPTNSVQTQEATLFQSNLRDIGVTLNLVPIAFADYLTSLSDPAKIPQLMLLNDQAQVPDPGTVLLKTYGSKSKGTNKSGYSNPKVDALLAKAQASGDAAARCSDYQQAQSIIAADAVTVNMYSVIYPVGYRKDLTGVVVSHVVNPLAVAGVRIG